jgi:hypothetical protein
VHGDGSCYLGRPLDEISRTSVVRVALVSDSVEELLDDEAYIDVMTAVNYWEPPPAEVTSRATRRATYAIVAIVCVAFLVFIVILVGLR